MYVLQSLAEVKSIVLLADINGSDGLILSLFSSFFDIVSGTSKSSTGEQLGKNAEYYMNEILVTLIDEVDVLPPQVVDIIVVQFLRAAASPAAKQNGDAKVDDKQTTLMLKELPAAYKMAQFLCDSCPEKMSRYISQYFNDVILDVTSSGAFSKGDNRRASTQVDSDDEDGNNGPSESDLKELNKAHRLLKELWRASAKVLQNVIPQLEAELSADNIELRRLATETLGDIISGIGAAGPPPPPLMDPAAYPPQTLEDAVQYVVPANILTTPLSPLSFAQTYQAVYEKFVGRANDKSAVIRAAWATSVGRIVATSAGGIGLSRDDEHTLIKGLADKLNDSDERVRVAAVRAVGGFCFKEIVTKLADNGGVDKQGSVLASLADRCRDKKHHVRVEGMTVLGRMWGVASGEIAAGNEAVTSLLGGIPTRILDVYYTNDKDIGVLLDHVMFEQLLPLGYPPNKVKSVKKVDGEPQASQSQPSSDDTLDHNKARVERLLVLLRSMSEKAKKAFLVLQGRQKVWKEVMEKFLEQCEAYNGGVVDGDEKNIKRALSAIVNWITQLLPDPPRANADLWKFVKIHDRRAYHLIRCSMDPVADFKTVYKAIKEFSKRIESAPGAPAGILETMIPIIYRSGSIAYNQSHLDPILDFSRSDEKGLGATAHELLKEISERNPDIFKAQIKEICKLLISEAPTVAKPNDIGSVKTLKACAGFARSHPGEISKDRAFQQALISFIKYSQPAKASKYAVSILLSITDRKTMHAKDLLSWAVKDWNFDELFAVNKLAAIAQITMMVPDAIDDYYDDIVEIAAEKILTEFRTPADEEKHYWVDDASLDKEGHAKTWAIKILVNRLRVTPKDAPDLSELIDSVSHYLKTLIEKNGDFVGNGATPRHHETRLRLLAAQQLLKLSTRELFPAIVKPAAFNLLAAVAQDPIYHVRKGFVEKLQKYLVQDRLASKFYTIIFLLAFEPENHFKLTAVTWLKSRAKHFNERKMTVMEALMPRLISLLAHHPDFSAQSADLLDMVQFILFYIQTIATEDNLGLIYKYAEKVKGAQDGIIPKQSENVYVLSDLATAIIRKWEQKKGWNMEVYAGKAGLTKDIFAAMPSHTMAQEVAAKNFLSEDMDELLDDVVKTADRKRKPSTTTKRKASGEVGEQAAKRRKDSVAKPPKPVKEKMVKPVKTPKKAKKNENDFEGPSSSAITASERRRSGRGVAPKKAYVDIDESEADQEMLEGVSRWEYEDGHIEPDQTASGSEEDDDEEQTSEPEDAEMGDADVEPTSEPVHTESSAAAEEPKASSPPRSSAKATPEPEEEEAELTPKPSAKRGRVRPPKAKFASAKKASPAPEPEVEAEAEGSENEVEPSPKPLKRGRGRPAKAKAASPEPEPEAEVEVEVEEEVVNATPQPVRRGRGRLPKVKQPSPSPEAEVEVEESPEPTPEPSAKRGRGRPSKAEAANEPSPSPGIEEEEDAEVEEREATPEPQGKENTPPARRGRGRAPKNGSAAKTAAKPAAKAPAKTLPKAAANADAKATAASAAATATAKKAKEPLKRALPRRGAAAKGKGKVVEKDVFGIDSD